MAGVRERTEAEVLRMPQVQAIARAMVELQAYPKPIPEVREAVEFLSDLLLSTQRR